jgi:two-component system cell cycle sensor histidine kinase/response regulator CckA
MKKRGKFNSKEHVPFKVAIIYAIFSALWILLSDQILYFMIKTPEIMTKIQMIKGWIFILTSALIIFFLLRKEIRKYSQAEEEIIELSQFRESIIENANIWLNVIDANGNILIWNRAAEKISGYNKEAVVGHSKVWEWLYPDMEYREEIIAKANAIIQDNKIVEGFETNIRRKDGGKKIISWQSRNLKDDQSNIIGSIALGRDITARKNAEKEKRNAQRVAADHKELALVGQIAGKMAHDFNNILGIIMGNIELSLIECEDPKLKKTLELVFEQTLRGKNLTKNLVAFAKNQEPKQEFFKISKKIDLVLSLLKKDLEGIDILREDRPGVPELLADPGMVEHTLVNLIQNSVHATSMVENAKISIQTYHINQNICFEIEDNGCGIPKEHIDNIYDPSFTLKGSNDVNGLYKAGIKGTGYGMANVKKYIHQHKGNIIVESEPGSGTKFTISLPVIKKELTIEEIAEIKGNVGYDKKYILLVEDEKAISDIQHTLLTQEPCNHKVDIAVNSNIAMELFNENDYDFVSLDYILPGNTNGMDEPVDLVGISKMNN